MKQEGGSSSMSSKRTSSHWSAGTSSLAATIASISIFQLSPASTGNDRPEASHSARSASLSGPQPMCSGPAQPRHHGTRRSEATTARPSRTTWMKRASGNTARMNPLRGQPVSLCRNTGLAWAWARSPKKRRNRSATQGMASAATRSREERTSIGDTSRPSTRQASDGA